MFSDVFSLKVFGVKCTLHMKRNPIPVVFSKILVLHSVVTKATWCIKNADNSKFL